MLFRRESYLEASIAGVLAVVGGERLLPYGRMEDVARDRLEGESNSASALCAPPGAEALDL